MSRGEPKLPKQVLQLRKAESFHKVEVVFDDGEVVQVGPSPKMPRKPFDIAKSIRMAIEYWKFRMRRRYIIIHLDPRWGSGGSGNNAETARKGDEYEKTLPEPTPYAVILDGVRVSGSETGKKQY